jgi:hypothetical protein
MPHGAADALPCSSRALQRVVGAGATISDVAVSPTKTVEFDSELLERLRQRRPEMGDRELLESMARMTLGRETLRRVQERSTLSEDEAIELGVKAVHEARHDRRAAG